MPIALEEVSDAVRKSHGKVSHAAYRTYHQTGPQLGPTLPYNNSNQNKQKTNHSAKSVVTCLSTTVKHLLAECPLPSFRIHETPALRRALPSLEKVFSGS